MLKIYNSLTQQKEFFKPIESGKVKLYVCGPTVYDFCHVGNARSFTAFDGIVRYLHFRGYDVVYVRNITDIDDKIIKRANENHEDFNVIVERFTAAFREDMQQLNLLTPTHEPRATECIPHIIAMIEKLISNEYAYIAANGDVYYNVRRFSSYGCLSHRNIDELESGARVEISDIKNDPLDFVLWKMAKPDEPSWESPWGKGRPGWHIECSAMSARFLGETFDMHGGGKDLIFPHHENEIAQSEGSTGKKFVNYWLHAGYLQIDKEKMSKSLGNFFTIRDVLQDHSPEALRYLFISGHYRSPLNFSKELLEQSRHSLERFYTVLRDVPPTSEEWNDSKYEKEFIDAMDDDFNTPVALSVLFELAHEIQRLREKDLNRAMKYAMVLKKLGGVLGILQDDPLHFFQGKKDVDVEKIEKLIAARNRARAEKNWAEADRIRKELSDLSIVLEDGASGTSWKKNC